MEQQEPRGQELINRYRNKFKIPGNVHLTEELILDHWELEKQLTKELLASEPHNRWETFERCYTELHASLNWRKVDRSSDHSIPPTILYGDWANLIGPSSKTVYEIGSGKGQLIEYLASCGYECKGSEISRERGEKYVSDGLNLSWGISDGVHLTQFETPASYDVVISKQVIEHLHPEDITDHFKGVFNILAPGGRYIFTTPHSAAGPADISIVFNSDKPKGMHLKEYTYHEIKNLLRESGFSKIYSVMKMPTKVRQILGFGFKPKALSLYLSYQCVLEKLILALPKQEYRRKATLFSRLGFFAPDIFIMTQKEF